MLNLQNLTKSGTHRPVISEDDACECPYVKQKNYALDLCQMERDFWRGGRGEVTLQRNWRPTPSPSELQTHFISRKPPCCLLLSSSTWRIRGLVQVMRLTGRLMQTAVIDDLLDQRPLSQAGEMTLAYRLSSNSFKLSSVSYETDREGLVRKRGLKKVNKSSPDKLKAWSSACTFLSSALTRGRKEIK